MLDFPKVIKELHRLSDQFFLDLSLQSNLAQDLWKKICNDPTFLYKVKSANVDLLIPYWQDKLSDIYKTNSNLKQYCVLSVDGSQIYTDRHRGIYCFLINIGFIKLFYGFENKGVFVNSDPYIYVSSKEEENIEFSTDFVDLKREEMELDAGFNICSEIKEIPKVFLFDGSLIFWHLDSKKPALKKQFLSSYLSKLQKFYENNILLAGYISLPRNRELVNLLILEYCSFDLKDCNIDPLIRLVDSHIARAFLKPGEYSTIFKNNSKITENYSEHLKPYFFYINVGKEIGRVEVPAWIANDREKVSFIAEMIFDQCEKGNGYPVALAEAHEQAVVKNPDKEMFFHLINKLGSEQKHNTVISRKSLKKRRIGI